MNRVHLSTQLGDMDNEGEFQFSSIAFPRFLQFFLNSYHAIFMNISRSSWKMHVHQSEFELCMPVQWARAQNIEVFSLYSCLLATSYLNMAVLKQTPQNKLTAGQSQFSIKGLFSGPEGKVKVMGYFPLTVRSNKKQNKCEVVYSEKILPHCPVACSWNGH